jgi:hypothetical protein
VTEGTKAARLPVVRIVLAFVLIVVIVVVAAWPCLVYRTGDLIIATTTKVYMVGAAIDDYREKHGGAYPPGVGRGLFAALRAAGTIEQEPEAVYYSPRRETIGQALSHALTTRHGHYEWLPSGPIPPNERFRGPKRPLAEIAAQGKKDAVVCAVILRLRDGSREVIARTLGGDVRTTKEGEPGYDEALAATTEDEAR